MKIIILISFLVFFSSCYDPFLPETGNPVDEVVKLMDTPEKTIRKLQEDYEYKNIYHFKDTLIYDTTFKYLIQEKILSTDDFDNISETEKIENSLIVPNATYLRVNYTKEIELHTRMFDSENDIYFESPLTINKKKYYMDSTEVYVWTNETRITISAERFEALLGQREYSFNVQSQIFHLKLDTTDSQWKIYRWYELN